MQLGTLAACLRQDPDAFSGVADDEAVFEQAASGQVYVCLTTWSAVHQLESPAANRGANFASTARGVESDVTDLL
jgi:hypothetical protein